VNFAPEINARMKFLDFGLRAPPGCRVVAF
jgi:hypothetical protein